MRLYLSSSFLFFSLTLGFFGIKVMDAAKNVVAGARDKVLKHEGAIEKVAGVVDFANPLKRIPIVGKQLSVKHNVERAMDVIRYGGPRPSERAWRVYSIDLLSLSRLLARSLALSRSLLSQARRRACAGRKPLSSTRELLCKSCFFCCFCFLFFILEDQRGQAKQRRAKCHAQRACA